MTQAPPTPTPISPPPTASLGNLPLALAAGITATAVVAVLYWALAGFMRDQVVPGLLAGPVVGLAVRFAGRGADRRFAIAAAVGASLGFMAGFIWADSQIWSPFMLGETLRRMFGLPGIIVHFVAVNVGYVLGARRAA